MSQMLPKIIESLIILLTAYAGAVIFLFPGDLREGWRWRITVAGAVFVCAGELLFICITRLGVSRAFWGGGIFALLLACGFFLSEEPWKEVLYCVIWGALCSQYLLQMRTLLSTLLFGPEHIPGIPDILLMIALPTAGLCMLYRFVSSTIRKGGQFEIGPRQTALAVLGGTLYEIIAFRFPIDAPNLMSNHDWMAALLGELCLLIMLYMENEMFRNSAMQQELATLNVLWQQQRDQYALTKENIELINHKCHDLKHQIRAYRSADRNTERDRYLDEIAGSIRIYESIVKTGSEVLDTILTEKSLVCTEKGIKINCVADGAQLSFMDPVDLYTIFGNAIDNAIEEVSKTETDAERQIDIMIFKQKCFVAVQIINPVTKTPKFVGGLPLTTKEDNGYHGYGVKSIRHTVEKYGGNMVAKVENGCFVLKLLIPVP